MLLKVDNLIKRYGEKVVVDHLTFTLKQGELVAFIGTNGAGKSTTIKMLLGLLKPDGGRIERSSNLKIGIVFQDSILDNDLTVADNLKIRSKLYHLRDDRWFSTLCELLEVSENLLKREYGTLSGGQQRKVDIMRALLHKPNLLFLDEPTTGLDIQTRQKIWEVLRYLQKKEQMTIFLTTHYLEEAEQADWTYIVDNGKILAEGSSNELKKRYAQNYVELELFDKKECREFLKFMGNTNKVCLPIQSSKEAIALLEKYQDKISDFSYVKGDMNTVFLTVVGRELN